MSRLDKTTLAALVVVYGLSRLLLGDLVEMIGWAAIIAMGISGYAMSIGLVGHHFGAEDMFHFVAIGAGNCDHGGCAYTRPRRLGGHGSQRCTNPLLRPT